MQNTTNNLNMEALGDQSVILNQRASRRLERKQSQLAASKMMLTCCVSSLLFTILILLNQTPQFNCQKQQTAASSEAEGLEADELLPCNRHRNQLAHSNHQPQIKTNNHHQHQANHHLRQQRQFKGNQLADSQQVRGRAAQLVAANEALQAEVATNNHQQQQQPQPEEFSLTTSATQSSQGQGQGQRQSAQAQSKPEVESIITTPSLPNEPLGSPVVPQPPSTTSSSVASPSSTQQQQTVGAPQQQPPAPITTSATAAPAEFTNQRESADVTSGSNKQQATSRRIEEDAMKGNSIGHQSINSNGERELFSSGQQQGLSENSFDRRIGSLAQSMSSSPSSISIITPLIGPPNQQQQQPQHHTAQVSATIGGGGGQQSSQQSAMMKPIYVVGNPISEPEYNSAYEPQSSQHSLASGESAPIPKAAKGLLEAPTQSASNRQQASQPTGGGAGRSEKRIVDSLDQHSMPAAEASIANATSAPSPYSSSSSSMGGERMSGPTLIYSDGQLTSSIVSVSTPATGGSSTSGAATNVAASSSSAAGATQATVVAATPEVPVATAAAPATQSGAQQTPNENQPAPHHTGPPAPRLFQGGGGGPGGAAVLNNNPRRPSLPPPVNQANAASGFRSPLSPSGPLVANQAQAPALQPPVNGNSMLMGQQAPAATNFYQTSPPYASGNGNGNNNPFGLAPNSMAAMFNSAQMSNLAHNSVVQQAQQQAAFLSSVQQGANAIQVPQVPTPGPGAAPGTGYSGRRPLNITRVEHISAECSNDLIRAVIVFNGTFKGIIYSSGYVSDPTCLYVNGTGSTRYEFSIRLNQCGTLGRQELHQPTIPGEARRRDQVMWNTLSIQYNSIIEQEWDEHYRVSCEYGSDFWKTVSFSPFNVETNTGSPVVFTINPPQCQMDVLLGHGMGPKIAVDGPVTVGDPLTLLIHMKSEKAGYDILVKNCVAHNGGKQRMQLIDSNGCVVNERFISPFRGTYNDNDLRHVTLYAYLKAFRFTGSPVLYLECEIHMCQSACPPQMCYWRRLSKRSIDESEYEYTTPASLPGNSSINNSGDELTPPVMSDSLSLFKALQVRQESEPTKAKQKLREVYAEDDEASLVCYRPAEVFVFMGTTGSLLMLVIVIAISCCFKIRKLTRGQFEHNRMSLASSLSPSLLSISDAISTGAGSLISCATSNNNNKTATANGFIFTGSNNSNKLSPHCQQASPSSQSASSIWHSIQHHYNRQQPQYQQHKPIRQHQQKAGAHLVKRQQMGEHLSPQQNFYAAYPASG